MKYKNNGCRALRAILMLNQKIPVLTGVLVFLFLSAGCGRGRELKELTPQGEFVRETDESGGELSGSDPSGADISGGGQPGTQSGVASDSQSGAQAAAAASQTEAPEELVVHICGAVNRPGVYTLPAGSRVCDALERAGGLREDASDRLVNQAAPLTDGLQIVIPTLEEAQALQEAGAEADSLLRTGLSGQEEQPAGEEGTNGGNGALVNLNTADLELLMTLPGVGRTRAEAILAYRQSQGAFQRIEEIMQVSGIKEGSFEKLKDYICVE